jgi:putative ABC transport system ATP-binding protein
MKNLNKNQGVTFLFSTHDKLVMDFAERIVNLRDGKIIGDNKK